MPLAWVSSPSTTNSITLTSTGALSAIDLFAYNSTVESSMWRFESLVRKIFRTKTYRWEVCSLFASWWNDSKHDSRLLEDVMRQSFGLTQWLFNTLREIPSRIKLRIVTTTSYDSQLCIFTNYRGYG